MYLSTVYCYFIYSSNLRSLEVFKYQELMYTFYTVTTSAYYDVYVLNILIWVSKIWAITY